MSSIVFFLISSVPCFSHFLPVTFLYSSSSMYSLLHSFCTFCRSGYGNCSKISPSFSRPTGNHTAGFNGQSINSLQPLSPNQESPSERRSPPMVAGEQSDFSHGQETCLRTCGNGEDRMPVACSQGQESLGGGANSKICSGGGEGNIHRPQFPSCKANNCPGTAPQQSVSNGCSRESLISSHLKSIKSPTKSPPDSSPLKNHFVW